MNPGPHVGSGSLPDGIWAAASGCGAGFWGNGMWERTLEEGKWTKETTAPAKPVLHEELGDAFHDVSRAAWGCWVGNLKNWARERNPGTGRWTREDVLAHDSWES